MHTNCIVEALREFRRRLSEWCKDPKKRDHNLLARPSRHPGLEGQWVQGDTKPTDLDDEKR